MTDYLGPLTLGTATGTYRLMKRTVNVAESPMTIDLDLLVVSTSADALAAALEAIPAACFRGATYVHYEPGVTNPVVYRVTSAAPLVQGEEVEWPAFRQSVSIGLTVSEQPAGALTTLYNAQDVSLPTSVTLAALLGTRATRLDVTIDDQTAGNTDMHSVWAALAPAALTDAKWLVLATALTWTTMLSDGGASMDPYWGAHNKYTTSASWQTAPLDTSLYPAGKYRLLARVAQEAGTGYVMDSQNQVAVPITRTTPHLVVVGDLDLPVQDTAYGVASNLTLSVRSDGTNDCIVNAFVLLPLDLGYFSWHPDVASQVVDQLDVGPTGIFMDGVTDHTYLQGGVLVPQTLAAHTGSLIATASPTANTWPGDWGRTDSTHVTADTGRIKMAVASHDAWFAATVAATPLVVPGEWYEIGYTHDVDDAGSPAGSATVNVDWMDVDGNVVRTDVLATHSAAGASTAVTLYAKAPIHAARAQVRFAAGGTVANRTFYFSAVSLRRCPLRLIMVAEGPAGALTSNLHPAHLTLKYVAKQEVAR